MSVYNERLLDLGGRAAELIDGAENLDESTRDLIYTTVLAAQFEYQVKNGGFGQLIYNVGRERLEQFDGMLCAVDAPVALSFYRRAIRCCVDDLENFDRLMDDFVAMTELSKALMQISLEYLKDAIGFDAEITEFIDHAEAHLPPV